VAQTRCSADAVVSRSRSMDSVHHTSRRFTFIGERLRPRQIVWAGVTGTVVNRNNSIASQSGTVGGEPRLIGRIGMEVLTRIMSISLCSEICILIDQPLLCGAVHYIAHHTN
jgi:hypothetical protein